MGSMRYQLSNLIISYPRFYGSGAVYLGWIQERPYKVPTYLVGGGGG